jgi:GTP-binding protein Era
MSDTSSRSGFVAIIGAPNAGKSTLVNRLVGSKVSIVTHKVQTTRFQVRGVMMRQSAQAVLVDTPGIFAPKRRLDRAMVRSAWDGAGDADVIVHLVDARHWIDNREGSPEDLQIIEALSGVKAPVVLAINKIDLVPREQLLAIAERLFARGTYTDVFMIAGLSGDGVDALADHLVDRLPVGPFFFPEDQVADIPVRLLAAEITREKLMMRLHQELPYQLTVETEEWAPHRDGSVKISQVIYVSREGHRSILLGKGGERIKEISMAARREMTDVLQRRIHLFLRVKVAERWDDRREHYAALGLDFDA